ncbi:hypothetical protein L1987_77789 [Smallanthus sonchifolius]|uniref:Uncharacterized protein n=1 Tax=Smallanthus sonchifolius TaxID=185202 RepID=A0ACB8ZB34_9ASTR|nr:hypothetical protein L1987_77789 [Smallanthus sonchifolius]
MFNTVVRGHIMENFEPAECEEMFKSFAQAKQQYPSTRTSIPSARAPTSSPRGVHQSAFHDLQRTVEDISKSLKDRQGGPSSSSNASVMGVSVRSVEEKVVAEDDPYSCRYNIPSPEEVKKIDWRARFAETDAKMAEEHVDEEIIVEVPAKKVEEKKKGAEMQTPEINPTRVPYPARLLPFKQDREHGHFLELFKQLKVNLSLIETLQRMPKYGKFLKDLLSNKKKLEEVSKVSLSEQCSAVVQNKLPEKLGDSGHFTIPCLLGSLPLHHALADLGASINLMPYSLYKQLDLGEPQPTRMSISLVDRSVKYPRGIVENLLVKVNKFVFPMDFDILDMEVDDGVPLILGRPFLRTAKALIDVFDGKLTLCVGGESSFSMPLRSSFLSADDDVYSLSEILAQAEQMVCKAPIVESVEDPGDPGGSLEVISIENPIHELPPNLCSKREAAEPTPSPNTLRSMPPRKRTRTVIESSDFRMVQTPSVGKFKGDKLLGYLRHVIFGPGRYKLCWKDLNITCKITLLFGSSMIGLMWNTGRPWRMKAIPVRIKGKPPDRLGFALNLEREIIGNKVPGVVRPARTQSPFGRVRMLLSLCKGNPAVCATVTEMLYGAH